MSVDLTGRVFTYLTVLRNSGIVKQRTHYICLCKCGKETLVSHSKLLNGHTRSCGCLRDEVDRGAGNRKAYGESARNALLSNYKRNAKTKGHEWGLTNDEAIALFQQSCHYCGRSPYTQYSKHERCFGEYTYTGIDRKDNVLGYTLDNSLPCCTACNYKKGSQSYDDFVGWVRMVAGNLGW